MTGNVSVTNTSVGLLITVSQENLSASRHIRAGSTEEEVDKHVESVQKELAAMIKIEV